MLKVGTGLITILLLLFLFISPSFAADPTISPSPSPSQSPGFTSENDPHQAVIVLKSFIASIDSFLGGFMFFTPDVFGKNITLKDGTVLAGVERYRNIFETIAIPVVAIVIAFIAAKMMSSERPYAMRSFLVRLSIVAVLFLIAQPALSYTIQINNALVNKISSEDTFTGFINDYLDNVDKQITNGASPDKFAIPDFSFSLIGGVFKSIGKMFIQLFLFIITFVFFLFGFLFILFQAIIRFATLLFLSVVLPLTIPFVLSERTESIVKTYFQIWFSFLIHQPAFVLGYVIAINIFRSMLEKNGASLGMLFFYTGFLFFLGGVNMLVSKLFGDAWSAVGANVQASLASVTVNQKTNDAGRWLQRGARYVQTYQQNKKSDSNNGSPKNGQNNNDQKNPQDRLSERYKEPVQQKSPVITASIKPNKTPAFTQEMLTKGMQVQMENEKMGTVSISGTGYQYNDAKNGVSAIYSTRADGMADGVKEKDLYPVPLRQDKYIDLSHFDNSSANPHIRSAQQKTNGHENPNAAYLNSMSAPQKVQKFLTLAKERNEALGIKGVIVKRYGNVGGIRNKTRVVRMYTLNNDETS